MTGYWLPGARRFDLSANNGGGPFAPGQFMGLVLHVNVDEHGTPDSFFADNPEGVVPNFQVYKSAAAGGVHQYLPLNWQPAAQVNGNARWAAVETAGLPGEPLTAYQLAVIEELCLAYHLQLGMPLQVTDSTARPGLGTHAMGGMAWGGHSCPGPIRAAQRPVIIAGAQTLAVARPPAPQPNPTKGNADMVLIQNTSTKLGALIIGPSSGVLITDPADYNALRSGGVPAAQVTDALFNKINQEVGGMK